MEQALINLDNVLSCANLTRKDIIQCRLYITDINGWDEVNNIYKKYFEDHKPARAILPVGELHYGSLIEIEAVAEVNN